MEVTAKLKYARISPQKCRLVADVVRGAPVGNAISTLRFMPKKGAEIVLKGFNIATDVVIADLKSLLDGANVDVNQPKTASGCMSSQGDSDCAPIFANLGLSFAGNVSPGQKFFKPEAHTQTAELGKTPGARK